MLYPWIFRYTLQINQGQAIKNCPRHCSAHALGMSLITARLFISNLHGIEYQRWDGIFSMHHFMICIYCHSAAHLRFYARFSVRRLVYFNSFEKEFWKKLYAIWKPRKLWMKVCVAYKECWHIHSTCYWLINGEFPKFKPFSCDSYSKRICHFFASWARKGLR